MGVASVAVTRETVFGIVPGIRQASVKRQQSRTAWVAGQKPQPDNRRRPRTMRDKPTRLKTG